MAEPVILERCAALAADPALTANFSALVRRIVQLSGDAVPAQLLDRSRHCDRSGNRGRAHHHVVLHISALAGRRGKVWCVGQGRPACWAIAEMTITNHAAFALDVAGELGIMQSIGFDEKQVDRV